MTPAAVPVAAAVIMAVPNYKGHMVLLKVKQRPVFEWPLFFQKKTQQKIQTNKQKIFKMEMMNKCHFCLVPFHVKKKIPAKPHPPHPLVHLLNNVGVG